MIGANADFPLARCKCLRCGQKGGVRNFGSIFSDLHFLDFTVNRIDVGFLVGLSIGLD